MARPAHLLVALFLLANLLGLLAASNLQGTAAVQQAAAQHEGAESGIFFFLMIGAATALMLVFYRFNAELLIRIWMVLALVMTTFLFFGSFFDLVTATLLTGLAFLGRYRARSFAATNLYTVFPFAGAGALFGSILGFVPAVLLLGLLSVYDYVSVNISQHMVSLAKSGIASDTFMGFSYPKEDGVDMEDMEPVPADEADEDTVKVGMLGGGDIVIPMLFAVAALRDFGPIPALMSVLGATVLLHLLLTKSREGQFYPAIPVVASGAVAGFLLGLLLTLL